MSALLTREQILAMAPDDSSIKAANGLTSQSKWPTLGVNAQALWGECKGSGSKPYQTQIELSSMATRCSCPSRKFPCKHALALMLMHAQQEPRFSSESESPLWVNEWLNSRQERAAKKEEKAANPKPVDVAKQAAQAAKRQNARWKRMESGAQDLQRWLTDQFQRGFATFDATERRDGKSMAARMVDAQAPGLGRELENAMDLLGAGSAYQQQAIERLGLLQLLVSAALRKDALSPAQQADVQTAMGWSLDKEDVRASALPVTDEWLVLGQYLEELDAQLTERRIWLYGKQTQQYALLLDFAYQGRGLEWSWASNYAFQATLAYYPGTVPIRAIVIEQNTSALQNEPSTWPELSTESSVNQASTMLATNPWLLQVPLVLPQTRIIPLNEGWVADTAEGIFDLKVSDYSAWTLMAYTAGHPVTLFAEWDGQKLMPLSAQATHHPQTSWSHLNPRSAA